MLKVEIGNRTMKGMRHSRCSETISCWQKDDKFLTAIACEEVRSPRQCSMERLRNLNQAIITRQMSLCIVQLFKVIDINQQQRERLGKTMRSADFNVNPLIKCSSIRRSCKSVSTDELGKSSVCMGQGFLGFDRSLMQDDIHSAVATDR